MNISQHSIIPLGYPSQRGYYNSSGTLVGTSSDTYVSLQKSFTFGCNKVYRAVPQTVYDSSLYYGNVRGWDVTGFDGEPVQSSTVNLNSQVFSVFDFNEAYDICSYMTTRISVYFPIIDKVFLIFYKDNTPSFQSLSLGNPLSSDVIEEPQELF